MNINTNCVICEINMILKFLVYELWLVDFHTSVISLNLYVKLVTFSKYRFLI